LAWSDDEGWTWSEAVPVGGAFSVYPSLRMLPSGIGLLSGGRSGLYLWTNADGSASTWEPLDLEAHHNRFQPAEPIDPSDSFDTARTTSYTDMVVLDANHLLLIYDRVPDGWSAIPSGSPERNSVWVVRVTVDRAAP
jgi:hypothetical protein